MENTTRSHRSMQKAGGLAALYAAASLLAAMPYWCAWIGIVLLKPNAKEIALAEASADSLLQAGGI